MVTKIDFLYFDAGGGHRAAATALKSVIEEQKRPWEIRLVNLQELLDPLDVFRKVTGIRLENLYNQMLAKGWTLGVSQILKLVHGVIRLNHMPTVRLLQEYWARTGPEMVVSLVPNFNRAIHQSLRAALPAVPYRYYSHRFCRLSAAFLDGTCRAGAQFLICGTEKAVEQARALGHAPETNLPHVGHDSPSQVL